MTIRPRWFSRHRLRRSTSPRLLGVIELPPIGGVSLEMHLVRLAPGDTCVAAWFDEGGRRWALVEAGRA